MARLPSRRPSWSTTVATWSPWVSTPTVTTTPGLGWRWKVLGIRAPSGRQQQRDAAQQQNGTGQDSREHLKGQPGRPQAPIGSRWPSGATRTVVLLSNGSASAERGPRLWGWLARWSWLSLCARFDPVMRQCRGRSCPPLLEGQLSRSYRLVIIARLSSWWRTRGNAGLPSPASEVLPRHLDSRS